ncbi:MAG: hypothetical protein JO202_06200 [Ktedonobacteraceae bacterium]|nr:hypothetical protein [Ktedonobacteraceae bacterium]
MNNQEVMLNLIVLTPKGEPQFILESTSQDQLIFPGQTLPQFQVQAQTSSTMEQADGPSLSELVSRQPEHSGGRTISEFISKEQVS